MTESIVKRQERGWAGHFICASDCLFRRNTLLTCEGISIVVSTVGSMKNPRGEGFEKIGSQRYYETMAFHSNKDDVQYHDADVTKKVHFDSPWSIQTLGPDSDNEANAMHETVVTEIGNRMSKGKIDEIQLEESD